MKHTFLNSRSAAIAAVILVALAGAPAGAQQEARVTAIRDDATRAVVIEQLSLAKENGVPTEPLLSRAFEGVARSGSAKRANFSRLLHLRTNSRRAPTRCRWESRTRF